MGNILKKCYVLLNYFGTPEDFDTKTLFLLQFLPSEAIIGQNKIELLALNVKSEQYQAVIDHFI